MINSFIGDCRSSNPNRKRKSSNLENCTKVMNTSESSSQPTTNNFQISEKPNQNQKPPFRPAMDDTKPVLQDPILRSDPIETEEAVLRLPPFSIATTSTSSAKII